MTGQVLSREAEQQRRGRVHRQLVAAGHHPRFVELTLLRMRRHDDLRRARALIQALDGYRHASR